ncbi:hypothetical protein [Aeromicrobium sp. UC242_57]|uniref:hypothetical protein n=1 Tax=Aeromicrobium sp. UC242_57 TaxID=3374624 RepID=UPI0037BAB634
MIGNGGDDLLIPGLGNDTVNGGGPHAGRSPGNDTISYVGLPASKGVRVDLAGPARRTASDRGSRPSRASATSSAGPAPTGCTAPTQPVS